MRKCVKCGEEKEVTLFRKRQKWFSHTCKSCYAAQYRTGKINTGRFQKGNVAKNPFKKGNVPWIKGKKHSLQTLKKLSEAKKGKKATEETKKKMSERQKLIQVA